MDFEHITDEITINTDTQTKNIIMFMESLTPKKIVEHLNKYIIGQDSAKRAIAVALRNRYRRLKLSSDLRDSITPKNLMMIGPTGVGKTEIARKIARLLGAPFVKVEATKYTEVGYVGRDVESMVRDLMAVSLNIVKKETTLTNKKRIQTFVAKKLLKEILTNKKELQLDDFDESEIERQLKNGTLDDREIEISVTPSNALGNIFGNMGVIGIEASIPPDLNEMLSSQRSKRKKVKIGKARDIFYQKEVEKFTDDEQITEIARWRAEQLGIIFIDEFDKIVSDSTIQNSGNVSREGVQRDILPIVEGSQVQTRYGIIDTENILFIAAGAFHVSKPSDLIPELQGRFPVRVELDELTVKDFVRILSETENSLVYQYEQLLATEQLHVHVSTDAVENIADIAYSMNNEAENIGARRLYTVMEKLFEDIMFHAPEMKGQSITIDKEYIQKHLKGITEKKDYNKYIL